MKFSVTNKIDEKDLRQILNYDKQSYTPDRCVSFRRCNAWLKKNDRIVTAVKHVGNVVGFFSFIPVTEKFYTSFLNAEVNECQLSSRQVLLYLPNSELSCLFCDIVVDKNFRDGEVIILLMSAFDNLIKKLNRQNIKVKRIVADCVSLDGLKLAKRMGFKPIKKHADGQIVELKF